MEPTKLGGEYKSKGEFHKNLDKNWIYYPAYKEKLRYIDKLLRDKKNLKILDMGCGEGVVVEKYRKLGYNITGFDLNYSSDYVSIGDILKIPAENESYDLVLCLDVIEHLEYGEQRQAIKELNRVLKRGGKLILAVPNLAHFMSRFTFLFSGRLFRTSNIYRHKGDRSIHEFVKMMEKEGFKIEKKKGIFPTYPLIGLLTVVFPSKVLWLHKFYNTFIKPLAHSKILNGELYFGLSYILGLWLTFISFILNPFFDNIIGINLWPPLNKLRSFIQ